MLRLLRDSCKSELLAPPIDCKAEVVLVMGGCLGDMLDWYFRDGAGKLRFHFDSLQSATAALAGDRDHHIPLLVPRPGAGCPPHPAPATNRDAHGGAQPARLVRAVRCMGALVAAKFNPVLRPFYQRLRTAGKPAGFPKSEPPG